MQINIDTKILERIHTHGTNAARLVSSIDDDIVDAALVEAINKINRIVAKLLGKLCVAESQESSAQDDEGEFNVADELNDLRHLVARAEALATAAESCLNDMLWTEAKVNRRLLERHSHLVGATSDAVEDVMEASDRLVADLTKHQSEL